MRKPLLGLVMSVVIAIAVYAAHARRAPPERASAKPATRSGAGAAARSRACRWRRSLCQQRGAGRR